MHTFLLKTNLLQESFLLSPFPFLRTIHITRFLQLLTFFLFLKLSYSKSRLRTKKDKEKTNLYALGLRISHEKIPLNFSLNEKLTKFGTDTTQPKLLLNSFCSLLVFSKLYLSVQDWVKVKEMWEMKIKRTVPSSIVPHIYWAYSVRSVEKILSFLKQMTDIKNWLWTWLWSSDGTICFKLRFPLLFNQNDSLLQHEFHFMCHSFFIKCLIRTVCYNYCWNLSYILNFPMLVRDTVRQCHSIQEVSSATFCRPFKKFKW